MSKIFNWFFGSFFRTLGRIVVFMLLGYILFNFINISDIKLPNLFGVMNVSADTDKYVKLDGDILNYKNFITVGQGNREIEFDNGNLYNSPDEIPQNFLITFCSDTPKISSWYSNISNDGFPHELNIYKTDIPCQFSTSDYSGGRIVYFYGTSFSFSVSGTNGSSFGKWTFYQPDNSSYQLLNFITTNDDISIDFSSGAVISQNQQIINQNQQIINGQNNIINNQNQNKNDIINNQNENTDKTIDSQKVCNFYDKNSITLDNHFLNSIGNIQSSDIWGVTDFISITSSTEITLIKKISENFEANVCFYNINKTFISCLKQRDLIENQKLVVPENSSFLRFSINKNLNEPQWQICQNGNQAISDGLNDINSSINDSSSPNLDGLNNSAGWLPPGAIDGILNLPLTFLNSLTTNLSKTCNPVDLPLPFVDKTLTLPCVNSLYAQIDGLQVWINSISVIASAFILFRYLMNLYKWVDDTLTFRENNFIDNWSGV